MGSDLTCHFFRFNKLNRKGNGTLLHGTRLCDFLCQEIMNNLFIEGFVEHAMNLGYKDAEISDLMYSYNLKQVLKEKPDAFLEGFNKRAQGFSNPGSWFGGSSKLNPRNWFSGNDDTPRNNIVGNDIAGNDIAGKDTRENSWPYTDKERNQSLDKAERLVDSGDVKLRGSSGYENYQNSIRQGILNSRGDISSDINSGMTSADEYTPNQLNRHGIARTEMRKLLISKGFNDAGPQFKSMMNQLEQRIIDDPDLKQHLQDK